MIGIRGRYRAHARTDAVETVAPSAVAALPDFSKLVEQNGPGECLHKTPKQLFEV